MIRHHIFCRTAAKRLMQGLENQFKIQKVLLHVDFSENYVSKEQEEVQSACLGHDIFSILIACCCVANENIFIISKSSDHSCIAAYSCENRILLH